jgi:hypothetical protein
MADDAVQVAVVELQQLVQPMDQFDIGVAAQFAENRGTFDGLVEHRVEFAEQCGALDFRHGMSPYG